MEKDNLNNLEIHDHHLIKKINLSLKQSKKQRTIRHENLSKFHKLHGKLIMKNISDSNTRLG